MKYLVTAFGAIALVSLAACGAADRSMANWSGEGSETCQDGIVYLQFTSGATPKIDAKTMTYAKC